MSDVQVQKFKEFQHGCYDGLYGANMHMYELFITAVNCCDEKQITVSFGDRPDAVIDYMKYYKLVGIKIDTVKTTVAHIMHTTYNILIKPETFLHNLSKFYMVDSVSIVNYVNKLRRAETAEKNSKRINQIKAKGIDVRFPGPIGKVPHRHDIDE